MISIPENDRTIIYTCSTTLFIILCGVFAVTINDCTVECDFSYYRWNAIVQFQWQAGSCVVFYSVFREFALCRLVNGPQILKDTQMSKYIKNANAENKRLIKWTWREAEYRSQQSCLAWVCKWMCSFFLSWEFSESLNLYNFRWSYKIYSITRGSIHSLCLVGTNWKSLHTIGSNEEKERPR